MVHLVHLLQLSFSLHFHPETVTILHKGREAGNLYNSFQAFFLRFFEERPFMATYTPFPSITCKL